MDPLALLNPNPATAPCSKTPFRSASAALRPSSYAPLLRFGPFLRPPPSCEASTVSYGPLLRDIHSQYRSLSSWTLRHRLVIAFSSSQEDLKHSPIEVDGKNDIDLKAKEAEEIWKQMLQSFKEQALKLQNVSEVAYALYSKKAMITLKETAVQLKIQADKAGQDLNVIAKEITEDGKEYLIAAAVNSPEPVKDVVETLIFSVGNLNDISKVHDFYLGIPYGLLLSLGGFLSFMLTGSISSIRFGVILGSVLLALSVSSLRAWKRGESFPLALKGQTVVTGVLFLRDIRVLLQRQSFWSYLTTLVSGAMLAFYLYRINSSGEEPRGWFNLKQATEE